RLNPKRVVFAEADNLKILKVAQLLYDEGVAFPMLLGGGRKMRHIASVNQIDLEGMPVVNPYNDEYEEQRKRFGELFFQKRQRRGSNKYEASKIMRDRNYFGCMMVETGEPDAMISGLTTNYPDTIRPALQAIGTEDGVAKIAGMYLLLTKRGPLFLADTT